MLEIELPPLLMHLHIERNEPITEMKAFSLCGPLFVFNNELYLKTTEQKRLLGVYCSQAVNLSTGAMVCFAPDCQVYPVGGILQIHDLEWFRRRDTPRSVRFDKWVTRLRNRVRLYWRFLREWWGR